MIFGELSFMNFIFLKKIICITLKHYAYDAGRVHFFPVLAESLTGLDTALHAVCTEGQLPFLCNADLSLFHRSAF